MPPLFWLRRLGSFLTLCLLAAAAWADALTLANSYRPGLDVQACQSASNSFQVSASKFFQLLRLI